MQKVGNIVESGRPRISHTIELSPPEIGCNSDLTISKLCQRFKLLATKGCLEVRLYISEIDLSGHDIFP